jgi:thiamine phosphate synthase YjbQ (UPF0047 family)
MKVVHYELELATRGHGHTIDVSDDLTGWLHDTQALEGMLTVFVPGSTAAVTTIEVVVVECDLKPRRRRVVFTFAGSCGDDGCHTSS